MSDPFRESSAIQLYREAQIGLVLLAVLLTIFIYLAVDRFTTDKYSLVDAQHETSSFSAKQRTPNESAPLFANRRAEAWPNDDAQDISADNDALNVDPGLVSANHLQPVIKAGPSPTATQSVGRSSKNRTDGKPLILYQSPDPKPAFDASLNDVDLATARERQKKIAALAADLDVTLGQIENQREGIREEWNNQFATLQSKEPPKGTSNDFRVPEVGESKATRDQDSLPLVVKDKSSPGPAVANDHRSLSANTLSPRSLVKPPIDLTTNQVPTSGAGGPVMIAPRPQTAPVSILSDSSNASASVTASRIPTDFTTDDTNDISTHKELPQAEKRSANKQHVAVAGDSFYTIAQAEFDDGRYFRALYQFNKQLGTIDSELTPGAQIEIPSLGTLRAQFREHCPADESDAVLTNGRDGARSADERIYVTQPGDTLFSIAREQLGQASRYVDLMEMNRQYLRTSNHLQRLPEGTRLVLPDVNVQ